MTQTDRFQGYDWQNNIHAARAILADTMPTGEHSGYFYNEYGCNSPCCNSELRAAWQTWFSNPARLIEASKILASLEGFDALGEIGRVFAAIAAVPRAISNALGVASEAWQTPGKGIWYKVTGSRGKAKAHVGLVGECTGVYENTYGAHYYNRTGWVGGSTSITIGLRALGNDGKPVYVPFGQCTRVNPPEAGIARTEARERAKAFRAIFPAFVGQVGGDKIPGKFGYRGKTRKVGSGELCLIHSGTYQGKTGRVFWQGQGRIGVSEIDSDGFMVGPPMWIKATEALPDTHPQFLATRSSHTNASNGLTVDMAECISVQLAEKGLVEASAVWAEVAILIQGLEGERARDLEAMRA